MAEREHDIVVFGATGFTGGLTAEYLAQNAGQSTRWALAGRSRAKLKGVRERLGKPDLPLIEADSSDEASLKRLAESTKVVITTVGPYIVYGERLVAACAQAGTDYVDLTGEPLFADLMWLRYHEQAQSSGARIVHSCGFDSIPYDLGVLFTVQQLPEGVPIHIDGFVRVSGAPSGGTYHSALEIMSRLRESMKAAGERRRREPAPADRKVKGVPVRPHHDGDAGGWCLPFPTIDPQNVLRSARALDRYGPEFSFSLAYVVRRLPVAVGMAAGVGAAATLAQLPPARKALGRFMDPGAGPSPERRERSWFKLRFRGQGGGKRVLTEVSGGDPGYGETSKMLAEAALCLAHDQLPERAGQLTPAVAMGPPLIDRLQKAGIKFAVVE